MIADALSRKFFLDDPLFLALSSPIPDLLTTLQEFYEKDSVCQLLIKETK